MATLARSAFRLNVSSPLRTSLYASRSVVPAFVVSARLARRTLASASSSNSGKKSQDQNSSSKTEDLSNSSNSGQQSGVSPSSPSPTARPQRQAFASLDFAPPEPSEPEAPQISDGRAGSTSIPAGKRTGAKSAKDSLSSIERRRRRATRITYLGLLTALIGGWIWLGQEEEDEVSSQSTLLHFQNADRSLLFAQTNPRTIIGRQKGYFCLDIKVQ